MAPLKKEERSLVPMLPYPDQLYLIPLNRRPFFPGMAAPIVIEPGAYYEVLKIVAKTEHKCMGLFLTQKEDVNIYKIGIEDLYQSRRGGADFAHHSDGTRGRASRPEHGKTGHD